MVLNPYLAQVVYKTYFESFNLFQKFRHYVNKTEIQPEFHVQSRLGHKIFRDFGHRLYNIKTLDKDSDSGEGTSSDIKNIKISATYSKINFKMSTK